MSVLPLPRVGHQDANRLVDLLVSTTRGMVMEFGVAEGMTLRALAELLPERKVYGFDSFKGLPEDWVAPNGSVVMPQGSFACDIPKNLPDNVELVVGLFQQTLLPFLIDHPGPVAFVHIDCDLYSSTDYVLYALHERMEDTIIVFDEFRGLPEYDSHEGQAWREFVADTGCIVEELKPLQLWRRGATFRCRKA